MRNPNSGSRPAHAVLPSEPHIVYEQPLNERIRSFLRLEFLFQQAAHNLDRDSVWDSRATLASLLEILNIFSRTDLKNEVMKELERHTGNLLRLQQSPGVNRQRLDQLLEELNELVERLNNTSGPIGHHLKQNEFLNSILQRSAIPGGTCDFDLPAYHYWLQQPGEQRTAVLTGWLDTFEPIRKSIDLILRLTRHSSVATDELASGGFFQKALDVNLPCQLVRIALPRNSPYFTEISGGRHRFTVRFLHQENPDARPVQTEQDVEFQLTCCII